MLKKFICGFAITISGGLLLSSCGEYKKTDNGLQYKILKDSAGKNVEVGGVALVHMVYTNEKDSFSTYKQNMGQPIDIMVPSSSFKGSLEEGLTLLSPGDSAEFLVSSDSLYSKKFNTALPKEIKPGSFTKFIVKVDKVYSKQEVDVERKKFEDKQKEMKQQQMAMVEDYMNKMLDSANVKKQIAADQKLIEAKLKEQNITNTLKTTHGVIYTFQKNAETPEAQKGDTISVHYKGMLLDGTKFDSSEGKDAFSVVIGMGQVIPGWDEVLQKLSAGDKATVYIPSSLGYASQGVQDPKDPSKYLIPKNAPLVFDIEVVNVKK